jgi:hypothetical protein
VFFLTSNYSPIYWPEELEDGGQTQADIPVPNPEPGSVAMVIGAIMAGFAAMVSVNRKSVP